MSRRSSFFVHGVRGPAVQIRRRGFTLVELLIVLGIITLLVALVWPHIQSHRCVGHSRTHCRNNLKQITLALHNYCDDYGGFLPAYTVDADGKPLHSWRTLILPYLDQRELYEKIDLSKPWDDPANAQAAATVVPTFVCPASYSESEPNRSEYLAVVTPQSCIRPTETRPLSEITDGLPNTLMVIEVPLKNAVPGMSPLDADLQLVWKSNLDDDRQHACGFPAGFADGSVQFLSPDMPAEELRSLISAAGGDHSDPDDETDGSR